MTSFTRSRPLVGSVIAVVLSITVPGGGMLAQGFGGPKDQRESSGGIPTSLPGIFVGRGELLVFPFFAYTHDHNREYQPARLGFGLNEDFRGRFHSSEAVLFLGYGVTDWLTLELEASRIVASLDKATADPSAMPGRLHATGVGDLEAHARFRLLGEGPGRPGLFGFLEMTPATNRHKALIAEPNWDLKPGIGLVRDFGWGTVQVRVAAEWNREARSPDLGEVTIEYLKRISPSIRLNLALEGGESGTNDEWTVVVGGNYRLSRALAFKLDGAFGMMSKATDLEAQAGVMLWLHP